MHLEFLLSVIQPVRAFKKRAVTGALNMNKWSRNGTRRLTTPNQRCAIISSRVNTVKYDVTVDR